MGEGDISLVVPAYNEEDSIEDTLYHLEDLAGQDQIEDVYLMDDRSEDNTREIITNYLEQNNSDVKVSCMRENANKVGAIEEAVRHIDSDKVVLTDADTRLTTPEELYAAAEEMDEEEYGALALKVIPDGSGDGVLDEIYDRAQDFDYAMGRAMSAFTTGEKLRLDPEDKNVRCVAGAGGMYETDKLEQALEHHSGDHAGDDMETTGITQLILEEDINYNSDVVFETEAPKEMGELLDQRTRWSRGAIQSLSNHPKEYLGEMKSMSRYGMTTTLEAGITAGASAALGGLTYSLATGDIDQAAEMAEFAYKVDFAATAIPGVYAAAKGELKDNKTLLMTPLMPFYRASTFYPSRAKSQFNTVVDKFSEAKDEFFDALPTNSGTEKIENEDRIQERPVSAD